MPSSTFDLRRAYVLLLTSLVLGVSTRAGEPMPPVAPPEIPPNVVKLTDFGADGSGTTLNTGAFARALAALAQTGGGELDIPPGLWLTGPIQLISHLNFHLERGALIQFSGDYHLYPLAVTDVHGEKQVDVTSPLHGEHLESVAITGPGIIDGGGAAWRPVKKSKLNESEWQALVKSGGVLDAKGSTWWPSPAALAGEKLVAALRQAHSLNPADYAPAHQYLRPRMVRLLACHRVLLEDVTFQNPPNWTLNPALCEDVTLRHVTVHNAPSAQNSDALDLESCRRALICDSTFDAGDDGICLKSGKDAAGRRIGVPTEDVLVTGCTVYHAHGGFTIGSEMSGGVRHVRVENCTFLGTEVGLRFKSTRGRGGVVEDISISNIRMQNITAAAINFDLYYGGKSALEADDVPADATIPAVSETTPQFRDIHLENIICRGARQALVLSGLPEMPLHNLTFTNVALTARTGAVLTDAEDIVFAQVSITPATGPALTQVRVKNSRLALVPVK